MSELARPRITVAATVAPPPAPVTDVDPRCWRCGQKVAYVLTRPWRLRCPRCRSVNANAPT